MESGIGVEREERHLSDGATRSHVPSWLYWIPAAAQAAFIFYLSSLAGTGGHGIGRFDSLPFHDFFLFDKLSHCALYFILGAALLLGFRWSLRDDEARMSLLVRWVKLRLFGERSGSCASVYVLVITMGLLYALSDEIHQMFVPNRSVSLPDIVADVIGVGCACFVHFLLVHRSHLLHRFSTRAAKG